MPTRIGTRTLTPPSNRTPFTPKAPPKTDPYFTDGFTPSLPLPKKTQLTDAPPPLKLDVSTLKSTTRDALTALGLDTENLQVQLESPVTTPAFKTKVALLITELETSSTIPTALVDEVVSSGQELSTVMEKLAISPDTLAKVAQRLSTTAEQLTSGWSTADAESKSKTLSALFKLEYPPRVPIAVIEELATTNADLDTVKRTLGVSTESVELMNKLEGQFEGRWSELAPEKRMELMSKLFKHENLIPAYEPADVDARLAKLKKLIDAKDKPGFFSNLGDLALASLVNIVSDYVLFNALRYDNPADHGGQPVSMAYRIYQVSLQAASSVWLGANHGTGTAMAFWWNQWNAVNDFGYYGVGALADKLGVRPEGWDAGPGGMFDPKNPPTWFSWTVWALSHPGAPTTGDDILSAAVGSSSTTLALLNPDANQPWRKSTGDGFWDKFGRLLSKGVPGPVF